MLKTWIVEALSVALVGVAILLLQRSFAKSKLHFEPDAEEAKNFGEFPPDIPEHEFNGVLFV